MYPSTSLKKVNVLLRRLKKKGGTLLGSKDEFRRPKGNGDLWMGVRSRKKKKKKMLTVMMPRKKKKRHPPLSYEKRGGKKQLRRKERGGDV